MKYRIAVALDIKELTETVNRLIRKGWEPIGSMTHSGADGLYYQPLLKYVDNVKNKK
ncbi:hypothetical protein WDW89_17405 [Deltaproteobacteria bacterium TL4]